MKQKLLYLFTFLTITFTTHAQVANQPSDLVVCDADGDGFDQFDLTVLDVQVLGSQNPLDYTVTYHETQSSAINGINAVSSPYANLVQDLQTIYIRLENNSTGNADTTMVTLLINPAPMTIQPTPLELCDDFDESPGDGITVFDLTVKGIEIIGTNASLSVAYYETSTDAENQASPIVNSLSYTNITNPQTLFVVVTNTSTGCFTLSNFDIIVNPLPIVNINDISFCQGESTVIETGLSTLDFNFEWIYNEVSMPGEVHSSLTISQPGVYDVVTLDLITGCSSTTTINVEQVDCTDTDTDGVIDSDEDLNENGNLEDDDTDNDGIPNYLDDDDDGDNVETSVEISTILGRGNILHPFIDTDLDLIENYLDDDDDGDNVLTIDEDYNNNDDPTDDDTNSNMIPDYLENAVALNINQFNSISFSIYPNPVKTDVIVKLSSANIENLKIIIFDVHGKIFTISQHVNLNEVRLNTSTLSSGLYFVELRNGSSKMVKKLIKE